MEEAWHKFFDGVWDVRGKGEKVGNGGNSAEGSRERKEEFGGSVDVVGVEEEGVVVSGHTLESYMERVGVAPVVGTNNGVMVAEFNSHGVGGEKGETLEIGMMKKVEDGKGIESSGKSLGEEMEVVVWKALVKGFIREQSVPGCVENHDDEKV